MPIKEIKAKPGEGMMFKQTDCVDEKCCPVCSSLLPVHSGGGRPAVYCKEACKKRAMRARLKASRNYDAIEKSSCNSRKRQPLPVNPPASEKATGVSGTVHRLPPVVQKPVPTPSQSPVCRTFDDVINVFCR